MGVNDLNETITRYNFDEKPPELIPEKNFPLINLK